MRIAFYSRGPIDFEAPQGECKGKRTRLILLVATVEENKNSMWICVPISNARFPRARMPTTILRRHDLDRFAPFRKISGWNSRLGPPQAGPGRGGRLAQPNLGEHRFVPAFALDHAKIKNLLLCRNENFVLAPIGSAIGALCVALDKIILEVGTRHVPHPPLPIGVDHVRFVDTAALPVFIRHEHWLLTIRPSIVIPFQISNGVRSPQIRGGTRVVDSLNPSTTFRIPSSCISRAMTAALQVPRGTMLVSRQRGHP